MSRGRWSILIVVALVLVAIPLVGASSGQAISGEDNVGGVDPDLGRWHLRGDKGVTTFFYGNQPGVLFVGPRNLPPGPELPAASVKVTRSRVCLIQEPLSPCFVGSGAKFAKE